MQNPYFKSKVMTADRGQLLLMLYDGAIRFNDKAINLLAEEQKLQALAPMGRTLAIVQELQNMLDNSKAPELCDNLERLYVYIQDQILSAQLEGGVKPLESVAAILKELRSGWAEAIKKASKSGELRRAG